MKLVMDSIGAGHTVTALYELVLAGKEVALPKVDALKYQQSGQLTAAAADGELLTLKLRYKAPDGNESNWVPTDPKGRFEVLFRLYGPKKALFDKTWKLPDIEEVK